MPENRLYLLLSTIFVVILMTLADDKCPNRCTCRENEDDPSGGYYVDCTYQQLTEFDMISKLPKDKITAVNISRNRLTELKVIDNLDELKILDLSFNHIENIEPRTFDQTKHIYFLDLSENRLTQIPSDLLHELTHLQKLSLANNKLKIIDETFLRQKPWLYNIDISGNLIEKLPQNMFSETPRLNEINIADNMIRNENIDTKIFNQLNNLISIDLSFNRFTSVPMALNFLKDSLKVLKLSGNLFRKLDQQSFTGLGKLNKLHLNHLHNLTDIDEYTFGELCQLNHLSIADAKYLKYISKMSFRMENKPSKRCVNLSEIIFTNNGVQSVDVDMINWCTMDSVDIRFTAWNCDCKMRWIKQCRNQDPLFNLARCMYPDSLSGIAIGWIREDDFTCDNTMDEISMSRHSYRLLNATLFLSIIICVTLVGYVFFKKFYQKKNHAVGHIYYKRAPLDQDPIPPKPLNDIALNDNVQN